MLSDIIRRRWRKVVSGIALATILSCTPQKQEGRPDMEDGHFDYSKTGGHPGLFATDDDFRNIIKSIDDSDTFRKLHECIISYAEQITSLPELTFLPDDSREITEEAVQRLLYCSYAFRTTGDEKYLKKAEREINAVCSFSSWNPDQFNETGEISAAVATAYDWLYDKLSAATKEKVVDALLNKAINEYKHNAGQLINPGFVNQTGNSGLCLAALALFEDCPELSKEIIERSVGSIKTSLNMYKPDGIATGNGKEWRDGTDFTVIMLAALQKAFGTDLGLSQRAGFLNTAEHQFFLNGPNGAVNFGDDNTELSPKIATWWFAYKLSKLSLLKYEIKLLNEGRYCSYDRNSRLLPVLMPTIARIGLKIIPEPEKNLFVGEGDNAVGIFREGWTWTKSDKMLAVKAGKIGDGHADPGSFIYDYDGIRWVADPEGNDTDSYGIGCKGHSCFNFEGTPLDTEAAAIFTEISETNEIKGFKLDLTPIFGGEISSAERSVRLIDSRDLEIRDRLKLGGSAKTLNWRIMTKTKPVKLNSNCWCLNLDGKTMYMSIKSNQTFNLKAYPSKKPESDLVAIGFTSQLAADAEAEFTVLLSYDKPASSGETHPGYRGIWYNLGQSNSYEWNGVTYSGPKYSGGLATYTMKHNPIAIYAEAVNRTFFVYGGTTQADERKLRCMIGVYDHETGMVSRPVLVYDKYANNNVYDPHDNSALLIDPEGYLYVFVSGRSTSRYGYIFKSDLPYDISSFTNLTPEGEEFTYPQPMWVEREGIFFCFTKYSGTRELYYRTIDLQGKWSEVKKLAGMRSTGESKAGHYQFTNKRGNRIITAFNRHINGNVDTRTNIYYIETKNMGKTWTTIDGKPVATPVSDPDSPCLVRDYLSKGRNVYIKDINFDSKENPVILYVTSDNKKCGPQENDRMWHIVRWTGSEWLDYPITKTYHNYDSGSLWVEGSTLRAIIPSDPGPQLWGTGGEVVIWESYDNGATWTRMHTVTKDSERNHGYIRRPKNARDPFYAFWADGNPDALSVSYLYFGDSKGKYWRLPYDMTDEWEKPLEQ